MFRHGNVWILLYVDEVIIIGEKPQELASIKRRLSESLGMKNLGELNEFLGISFTMDRESGWLSQKIFVEQIIIRFGMKDCKPVCNPGVTIRPTTEISSEGVG